MKFHFPALHASPSPTYLSGVQLLKLPLLSQKISLLKKSCSMPPPCSWASPIMVALPCQLQLVTVIAGRCAPSCGLSGAKGSIWGSSQLQCCLLWLQEYKAWCYHLLGKLEVPRCWPPIHFGIAICNISSSKQSC